MNTVTKFIEAYKELSADEQAVIADFVTQHQEPVFELTDEEIAELNRRMNTNQKTYTVEEVFAKYGL